MLFNHLKYKHLPVCNHPPAWFIVSKVGSIKLNSEFITWIAELAATCVWDKCTSVVPPSQRVTVTFRAWWFKGAEKREGRGCWELEGVVWETMLSFLSCHMPAKIFWA